MSGKLETRMPNVDNPNIQHNRPTLTDKIDNGLSHENSEDAEMFDDGVHQSIIEAFGNSIWNNAVHLNTIDIYGNSFIPEDDETESQAINMIHSKLAKFRGKWLNLPDLSNVHIPEFYLPGLPQNFPPPFYKISVLTRYDQKKLFCIYRDLILNDKTLQSESRMTLFQELRSKVAKEYEEFQEIAKREWCRSQWVRVLQIPSEVETYIDSLWKMRAKQSLMVYPSEYVPAKKIPLTLHDVNNDYSVFEFIKPILTQKMIPLMTVPKIRSKPIKMVTEVKALSRIKSISNDSPKPIINENMPVSLDDNVERLVKRKDLDFDIVISMSGIKTLTDTTRFHKDWILPITVKKVVKENGVTKKVVIIDKNLPPKKMNVHDKNLWHAKIVAKVMPISSYDPDLLGETPGIRSTNGADMNKNTGLEANPGEELVESSETISRKRQVLISYDGPFADFTGEDIFSGEEFGVDSASKSCKNTSKNISTKKKKIKDSIVMEPEYLEVQQPKIVTLNLKKASEICAQQYEMWKIHKSNFNQFLKTEQRTLNVLVRKRIDGHVFHFKNNGNMREDVCISSKVEFQPEFGATMMTESELNREYVDLYMRPASKLLRVRTIGHTKELMLAEVKTIADITAALQPHVKNMQKLFDPLYSVLTNLVDLPPGRYMLHHTPKMEVFASLLKEGSGVSQFSLEQYCSELDSAEVNAPAIPIDPVVLTPLHYRDQVAPALFTPAKFYKKPGEIARGFLTKVPYSPVARKRNKRQNFRRNRKEKKRKAKMQEAAAAADRHEEIADYFGDIPSSSQQSD
ncbi:uncharacterized protein LOC128989377 isoform X2 [Macrosteles quadrilineatus]|uniref:uncharacterized protein LOC128989377 isoform X2 n=1 Tax=Macrosteles quadrilineatus TaxID=74068 RepID=UPI0023E2988D|nr:uncharacterized protein LOC128989377 isoform X2 [Macrosteles quadrilineatus]